MVGARFAFVCLVFGVGCGLVIVVFYGFGCWVVDLVCAVFCGGFGSFVLRWLRGLVGSLVVSLY